MPAVGLARESSAAAEKELAYEYQCDRLTEYGCKWVFGDRVSGTRDNRKGLEQALEKIRSGEADELVVTHLFRLGRSVVTINRVVKLLKEHKATLTILGGAINTTTPEGRAFLQSQAVWGEYEAELGAERQRIGWENTFNKGRPRSLVFGYKIENGKYVPDEDDRAWGGNWTLAQKVIEKFFELQSLTATVSWILAEYPHTKNQKRQEKPPITASGLKRWMCNPALLGHVYFKNGVVRHLNQHTPLMSVEQQKEVDRIAKLRIRHHGKYGITNDRKYAYSGLVKCGKCGSNCLRNTNPMRSSATRKMIKIGKEPCYEYFRCGKAKLKQCDNTGRVRLEVIEDSVINAIKNQSDSIALWLSESLNQKPKVNPRILELQEEIDRLSPVAEIDPSIKVAIEDRRRQINNLLVDSSSTTSPKDLANASAIMESIQDKDLWDGYSTREKGDRLRLIVKRIVISDRQITQVEFQPWLCVFS